MHPIQYKAADFEKLINNVVKLTYRYEKEKDVEIIGVIKQVYLSANQPFLPSDIELLYSNDSIKLLKESKIPIQQRICITEIGSIELIEH